MPPAARTRVIRRVRATIARLSALLARFAVRRAPDRDPWERFEYDVPLSAFGSGSLHDFAWYFEGECVVGASSLEEIQDWLLGCEYTRDPALFNEEDYWQHPRTFEQIRRGDCEDHALWAWRRLVELGFEADLVSGSLMLESGEVDDRGGHVWVLVRRDGEPFVMETVAKSREQILLPLAEVRDRYRPEFGVDRERRRYAFNGALASLRERERGGRR